MSAPHAKKSKESTTISLVVEEWKEGQTEQFSAVHRINGYSWRLRLYKSHRRSLAVELICDKSNEAELWMCTATVKFHFNGYTMKCSFNSWDKKQPVAFYLDHKFIKFRAIGSVLEVEIEEDTDGEKWRPRPILDPLEPVDGILVIGNEKINVHKASLASQSSFFSNLFFGNFKEKNMTEITIRDFEYEDFSNLLKIIYRRDGFSLTDKNVCKVLQLAYRFDLKIVEDVCVNFLLSDSSSLSIHQKLLISEEHNLPFLKDKIIANYTDSSLRVLVNSPEWEALSKETTKALIKKCLELVPKKGGSDSSDDSDD